jgi:hypothetical protein
LDTRLGGASIDVAQDSDLGATARSERLLAPPSQWLGAGGSMQTWLMAKAEGSHRIQQEALRLDQLRIAQANLEISQTSIDPTDPDEWKLLAEYMSKTKSIWAT